MDHNVIYSDLGDHYADTHNTSSYIYFDPEMHDEFIEEITHNTIVYAVMLNIWTLLSNLALVTACMAGKKTKLIGFHAQIINLCITNIFIALFIMPLTIYHLLCNWNFGEFMCRVYIITDVIMPFVTVLIIILLNVDRIIAFVHPVLYTWMFEGSFRNIILAVPWLTAVLIVVPLWTSGTIPYQNMPGECVVLISKEAAIACPVITFFLPMCTLIALTFRLLVSRLRSSSDTSTSSEVTMKDINEGEECPEALDPEMAERRRMMWRVNRSDTDASDIESPMQNLILLPCLLSLVFCLCWLPYQSLSLLLSFCFSSDCFPSFKVTQIFTWLGTSSAGVIPLILLVDKSIRTRLMQCCCMRTRIIVEMNEHEHSDETFV